MFELVVAPLAAALAFAHARRALGAAGAAGELLALAAYGFALEAVAMAVFASHAYDPSWHVAPLGVPLAVAAVWAAVITSAMAVAGRRGGSPASRAGSAALVAIALDLMIEPVATRAGLWSWTPPGPWLGVPIGNFVGWAVIVGAYAYGAERWAGRGPIAIQVVRRLALAAACIVALVSVGLVWTSLGLERVFEGGGGWAVWAGVLVGALWPMAWGRFAEISSWGGNVGAEPWGLAPRGRAPEAALCVVALAFAVEALLVAEPPVTLAAMGALATIALIAAGPPGKARARPSGTASSGC